MSKLYKVNVIMHSLVIKAEDEDEALEYYEGYYEYPSVKADPNKSEGVLWEDGEFIIVKDITELYETSPKDKSLHDFATTITEAGV